MAEEIITVSEAMKRLENKYTSSYILRLAKQGKVTGYQSGYIWLVSWPSLQTYASQEHPKGGSKKGVAWSKKKASASQDDQPKQPPAPQPAQTTAAPPARPDQPVSAGAAHPQRSARSASLQIGNVQPGMPMHHEAREGELEAIIDIEPLHTPHFPGGYVLESTVYRRGSRTGKIVGPRQQERGQALKTLLREQVNAAMQAAGWHAMGIADGKAVWRYQPGKSGSESQQ